VVTVPAKAGVVEDLVVFACNHHTLLSGVYAVDGAAVDHTGKRLMYIAQNCIAFFMSAVSGSVFDYLSLSPKVNIVFDLVVTTPATIAMAKVIEALYTCPIGSSSSLLYVCCARSMNITVITSSL
jgi:hypothetical protein